MTEKTLGRLVQIRRAIEWTVLVWLVASTGLFVVPVCNAAPPNIVVILVDDMDYGDAGCFDDPSKVAIPDTNQIDLLVE